MSLSQRAGLLGAGTLIAVTALASFIAPYDPGRQFSDRPFSPPMLPHLVDDQGHLQGPVRLPDASGRSARTPVRGRSTPTHDPALAARPAGWR